MLLILEHRILLACSEFNARSVKQNFSALKARSLIQQSLERVYGQLVLHGVPTEAVQGDQWFDRAYLALGFVVSGTTEWKSG